MSAYDPKRTLGGSVNGIKVKLNYDAGNPCGVLTWMKLDGAFELRAKSSLRCRIPNPFSPFNMLLHYRLTSTPLVMEVLSMPGPNSHANLNADPPFEFDVVLKITPDDKEHPVVEFDDLPHPAGKGLDTAATAIDDMVFFYVDGTDNGGLLDL